jgi:hypothetical protein
LFRTIYQNHKDPTFVYHKKVVHPCLVYVFLFNRDAEERDRWDSFWSFINFNAIQRFQIVPCAHTESFVKIVKLDSIDTFTITFLQWQITCSLFSLVWLSCWDLLNWWFFDNLSFSCKLRSLQFNWLDLRYSILILYLLWSSDSILFVTRMVNTWRSKNGKKVVFWISLISLEWLYLL